MWRIFFLILLILPHPLNSWAWPARVVGVTDGDTITVEPIDGGELVKIRLHGIDAPERNQPYGVVATGFVFAVALYQTVDVRGQGKDRYGRSVALVIMHNGESLQSAMLRAGLAWVWPRYCRKCDEWKNLQEAAKRAGRGLWAEENPVPPWEWRRAK